MEPIQELWIADGDEVTIRLVSRWFVASRGTIYALIELPAQNDRLALWRQHGGEEVWYAMLGEAGGLDELEDTAWDLGRREDGSWFRPDRREDLEA